VNTFSSLVLKI